MTVTVLINRTAQFSQVMVQCSPSQYGCNWPATFGLFHNFNFTQMA